tara:strand:- start:316 stop:522 length:207 start_codon:yes stop_codon:yes gene_type:complete
MLSKMFCRAKKTIKEYRDWQMKVYTRVQDTLEQRLAGIIAAKQKLAEQMERDATDQLHDDMRKSSVEE